MYGTERLDRSLDTLGVNLPQPEYAPHPPTRTITGGVKLDSSPPNRWASTLFVSPLTITVYTTATSPLHYLLDLYLDPDVEAVSLHDALRPSSFRHTDYLPDLD